MLKNPSWLRYHITVFSKRTFLNAYWIFIHLLHLLSSLALAMATKTKDFALIPASTPPPSLTSNLIDPPSQGYLLIVVFVIYLVTTTPIVATRMYTRQFINQKLWWDDCEFFLKALSPAGDFFEFDPNWLFCRFIRPCIGAHLEINSEACVSF